MSQPGITSIKSVNGPENYCLNLLSSVSLSDKEKLSLVIGNSLITFNKHTVCFLSPWISEILKHEYSCLENHVFISLPEEASMGGFQSLKAIIETGVAQNLSNCDKEELNAAIHLLGMDIQLNEDVQQNNDHREITESLEEPQESANYQEDVLSDIEDGQDNGKTITTQSDNNQSILIEDLNDESDIRKSDDTTPIIDFQEPEDDLFKKLDSVKECPICERRQCLSYSVYGASACNNCRLFFLRTVRRERLELKLEMCQYLSSSNSCSLKKEMACMPCRYDKCLSVGMKKDLVKTDEEIRKRYFFKGATEKVTKGPKEARSWNRSKDSPGKEVKPKKTLTEKKKMNKNEQYQHLSKSPQNVTIKKDIKERNITKAKLANKSNSKTNPTKTVTKRKKRGDILKMSRKLDVNSINIETYGHSDDMFEHRKAPSRVSQKNLEDSSSDDESDPDDVSKTPVINYVKGFGGSSETGKVKKETTKKVKEDECKNDYPVVVYESRTKTTPSEKSNKDKNGITVAGFGTITSKEDEEIEEIPRNDIFFSITNWSITRTISSTCSDSRNSF